MGGHISPASVHQEENVPRYVTENFNRKKKKQNIEANAALYYTFNLTIKYADVVGDSTDVANWT